MTSRGHRLLPSLVDELAATDPGRVLYSFPHTNDPKDGFRDISAKTMARAVNRCAWYLEDTLGRREWFPTLMYLGPQDLTYAILVLATIKTGYKLLLTSPRNSLGAHLSLLEKTRCDTFLLPPNFPLPMARQILAAREMRVVDMPGFQHWIEDGHVRPYPYNRTFLEARLEPFVVLHTSGSTGMPRPIIQTHATVAALDALADLSSLGLEPAYPAMCAGKRVYVAFPLFHCAGLLMLLSSIFSGFTVVLGPFPPSAEAINAVHVHGNVQHSCLAAASLTDLASNPEYLENLARLEQVTFGGGPLPRSVGDLVSTKTRLLNCLGTTECGILPSLLCTPEDWQYVGYSPALGSEFREISDGLYEHFVVRRPEYSACQGIFGTFPSRKEWPMKELYEKHPTKEDLWLYKGRADDIIVFSTGEILNPIDMEDTINVNPFISASLVTGAGRFQSSLLVEAVTPPTNDAERSALIGTIWPHVEAANKESPSHARIHRDMIIFTAPGRPMLRAGRGYVQRQATVELYAEEINALYSSGAEPARHRCSDSEGSDGISALSAVKQIVAASSDIDLGPVSDDANLFELGLDSLQVLLITKEINSFLADCGVKQRFAVRAIYSNPTIAALVASVAGVAERGPSPRHGWESVISDRMGIATIRQMAY